MVAEQFESLLRHSLTRLQRACTSDKRPKDKDAIAALTAECDRCIAALSPGMCAHQKSPTNPSQVPFRKHTHRVIILLQRRRT
jgi:hypothetical protein